MSITLRSLRPGRNWDSILAAIAGVLIIHFFCRHSGIGISPDSVDYLSTASNIRGHGSATNYSGQPLVNFPLGYPLLLAGIEWMTGHDALSFGPLLNEILFALLLLLCGAMMDACEARSRWVKWGVLTILVLNPCLLEVYSMVWSESLFLVLLLLFILAVHRYLGSPDDPPRLKRLWLPAGIAALACVTRYAGITMIALGGSLILLHPGMKWRRRIGHALIFGCVASSLLAINLWRNLAVSGTLTGHREPGISSLWEVVKEYGHGLYSFFAPEEDPTFHTVDGWLGIGVVVALIAWSGRVWRKVRYFSVGQGALGFFLIYSVFITFTATLSRFQVLDNRLLSPLLLAGLVPLVLIRPKRWVLPVMSLVWLLSMNFEYKTYRSNWEGIRDAGIPGYTEDDWTHSQTLDFVRKNFGNGSSGGASSVSRASSGDSVRLYSNADDAIWLLTGQHANPLPHKDFAKEIGGLLGQDRFFVAWFNDGYNADLVDIDLIGRYKRLVWVRQFTDGAVYYFISR